MAVDLGADLQQLAAGQQVRRASVQHVAAITQAGHAGAVQQVGVDARHFRVMSARTPSVRPESWSISLQVRRFRSLPVPDSNESMYSTRAARPARNRKCDTDREVRGAVPRCAGPRPEVRRRGSRQQPVTHECFPEERLVMRGRRPNEKRLRGVSPLSRCECFSLRGIVHGSATRASRPAPRLKPSPIPDPICAGRKAKAPWRAKGLLPAGAVRAYLAGTVTGARAAPGSFMNWKKLELGSTTSTSPGFENEAR